MKYAEITGWGKCTPPAILTNQDLATFMDTSDEWIYTRTGMKERRISHVNVDELAYVAAEQAIACAGIDASEIDGIYFGTTSPATICPNSASYVQKRLGNQHAASMDINSACCSFLFGLSNATSMIRNGMMNKVLVIGAEKLSWALDWTNRDVSVLFGDGAGAVVVEATDEPLGMLSSKLGCDADVREVLALENYGTGFDRRLEDYTHITWNFEGQEIFKRATRGMVAASEEALSRANVNVDDVDVVVPHQANLRIIEAVAKRLNTPMEKVMVNIDRYANTSAATIPIALCEAVEQGMVKANSNVLIPAFGAGLTWVASFVKWGGRVEHNRESTVQLPENKLSALELIEPYLSINQRYSKK